MAALGRLGTALDSANEGYDAARVRVGGYIEELWTKLRREVNRMYKRRIYHNLAAETRRRRTDYEENLPLDTTLSFYDDYEIINGCPVFTLDTLEAQLQEDANHKGMSIRKVWSQDVADPPLPTNRQLTPQRLMSFKIEKLKTTCYTFSHDDRYVVCGMSDGSLLVWDAMNGSLAMTLKGPHEFRIADVAFLRDDPSILVSVDLDGHCVKWNLNTYPVRYTEKHCAPSWDDCSYVGKELAVPRLSSDGRFLGFPIYTYVEPQNPDVVSPSRLQQEQAHVPKLYSIIFIFETDAAVNDLTRKVDPMLVLPVQIEEPWVGAERLVDLILFSRTSRCLLLTVYELVQGYVVLWPLLEKGNVSSYQLHGTRGRFSQGDKFLVTWHGLLASGEQCNDSNCYVWDLTNLGETPIDGRRSRWNHPYYKCPEPMVFGDPNEGNIHSCDFIRLRDRLGLVSCCVTDELKIIVWHLKTQTPMHVLKTDITRRDICPGAVRMLSDDVKQIDKVHGVNAISVSRNGQWLAVYTSICRRGVIWNVCEGVEVLRINIPEDKVMQYSGMDITFSSRATKLLFVGKSLMLLWSPSVLRGFNTADRSHYIVNSADDDIHMGKSVVKFSADGSTIAVMRFNSERATLCKLYQQRQFVLNRMNATQENRNTRQAEPPSYFQVESAKNRFCHFAIATDGCSIVTCMGDLSVLHWRIENVCVYRHIATLSSYYCPCLDICFSVDPSGRTMIVVCQDQGILVWIDLLNANIVDRKETRSNRSCKFSENGTTAVLMTNMHHVRIWDVINRREIRTLDYKVPIYQSPGSGFYPLLAPNGAYCLVGFTREGRPITANAYMQLEDLHLESIWYPETFVFSADSEWILMSGIVDENTDDMLMKQGRVPVFAEEHTHNPQSSSDYPEIDFREDAINDDGDPMSCKKPEPKRQQTWKIVHVRGERTSKQMRLPFDLEDQKFTVMSPKGCKCAALNHNNQLIVWGTHFTYKSVIQQRRIFLDDSCCPSRELIYAKLNEYGPSLLNHPYECGMTLVMECVNQRRTEMLKHLMSWALESNLKLAFQGRITNHAFGGLAEEPTLNVIDLAVDIRSPDILEILLQALTDGATTDSALAMIMESSLIRLSYKYPTLVLHLFKNPEFIKSFGKVNVSEGYLRKQNDYMGVITNKTLVASQRRIQEMWRANENQTMKNLPERLHHSSVSAEAKVVPYPNIAKMGREGILQPLLFDRVQHCIFGSDLVRGVINFKFQTYARGLLLEDLFHYLVLLLAFTSCCIYTGYRRQFVNTNGSILSLALVVLVGTGNLIRLFKQFHTLWMERKYAGLSYYIADYMKWIEFSSYIVVVFFLPLVSLVRDPDSQLVIGFMATASVLLWVKLLYYAQAFKSTGPMVVMIREIVKDIRWFLFVLLALLFGFGIAFFVLLASMKDHEFFPDANEFDLCEPLMSNPSMTSPGTDEGDLDYKDVVDSSPSAVGPECGSCMCACKAQNEILHAFAKGFKDTNDLTFGNPIASLLTVFRLMLSDIGDVMDFIYNSDAEEGTQVLALIMMFFFLAAVAIVLLNLLIAIMGDSFDRVKNHEKTLFLQKRAAVIQDMEMGLSQKRKKEINDKIDPYLHILVPDFQSKLEEADWAGRLVDIQRRMREELGEAKERGSNDFTQLQREIRDLKRVILSMGAPSVPRGESDAESEGRRC